MPPPSPVADVAAAVAMMVLALIGVALAMRAVAGLFDARRR